DPSLIARSIETQLRELIYEPSHLHASGIQDPVTIIVDGLNECKGQGMQEKILCAIRNSTIEFSIPLWFIIASRPEPHICELFESPFYEGHYRPFNVEQSFNDFRRYLNEFA
ncbi:hypothetical protein K438DRAFT_1615868, partial [Mycena galopus ATCC 62051]